MIQGAARLPGQAAPEGFQQIEVLKVVAAADVVELIGQPTLRICCQGGVAAVGPGLAQLPMGQAEPLLELAAGSVPGKSLEP